MNSISCSCGYEPPKVDYKDRYNSQPFSLLKQDRRNYFTLYCNGCGFAMTVKIRRFYLRRKKSTPST